MNRKILGGAAALLAAVSLVGAGTFAAFSDNETVAGNTISMGTLDLELGGEVATNPISVADAAPGYAAGPFRLEVSNAGSLPGNLFGRFVITENGENSCLEPEQEAGDITCDPDAGELAATLQVRAVLVDCDTGTPNGAPFTDLTLSASQWETGTTDPGDPEQMARVDADPSTNDADPLAGGSSLCYDISYSVPDTAGNEIQSDSLSFELRYRLDQVTS